MPLRPCLGVDGGSCSALVSDGNRCPTHRRVVEGRRQQGKRVRRPAPSTVEQARRASVVAAHRLRFGAWCPGWGVAPHPAEDLTADHVVAVAAGGTESGELSVLCRACNGRKAERGHMES
jgi:5-methylcytosine-specific restriction protein A